MDPADLRSLAIESLQRAGDERHDMTANALVSIAASLLEMNEREHPSPHLGLSNEPSTLEVGKVVGALDRLDVSADASVSDTERILDGNGYQFRPSLVAHAQRERRQHSTNPD
jgi:hypothetical protein